MTIATQSDTLTQNAQILLCKRYLYHDGRSDPCPTNTTWNEPGGLVLCAGGHETVDEFFQRVSMGNHAYRAMLQSRDFLPNSPTLFNLGTPTGGTLSACFKFTVEDTLFDSVNGIMPVVNRAVRVLKSGGGVGYSLSDVRPEGSLVASTHRSALGPLGVMRLLHTVAKEITQGGKRDAAQMAILHCDHEDVSKFIHAKDEHPETLGTFNISVALTDDFMRNAATYIGSREWNMLSEMAESAWRTGDPGVFFIDRAEQHNPTPWLGKLDGTNPCGEVPLLANEPCNLGSINLAHFVLYQGSYGTPRIDWEGLRYTVRLAIEYLDDVLDVNHFPDPVIEEAALKTRKLGLGVCGWADMLAMLGIHYDSDEAVTLADQLMNVINVCARTRSSELGEMKGRAPAYNSLEFPPGLRNATRTCIAPTGSISILMGASSGIEPHFDLHNIRTMGDGTRFEEDAGDFGEFVPHISQDIDWQWHIKHQAAFQKHTDLAVSKTINMANGVKPDDIREAYLELWRSKCVGGTVYRDGSRSDQVLAHDICGMCGAAAIHANGCIECSAGCGWSVCLT